MLLVKTTSVKDLSKARLSYFIFVRSAPGFSFVKRHHWTKLCAQCTFWFYILLRCSVWIEPWRRQAAKSSWERCDWVKLLGGTWNVFWNMRQAFSETFRDSRAGCCATWPVLTNWNMTQRMWHEFRGQALIAIFKKLGVMKVLHGL